MESIPVIAMLSTGLVMVTLHLALLLEPSRALQVMVTLPLARAVTLPLESTVASLVLLLIH